jgi:RNA polymerase sigma factor (sigma-70 family)
MALPSDTQLAVDVTEAAAGSVPAFERIYRGLAPSVASYLRWNGASDVEAVTNEVLAQVHQNLDRFSGDGAGFRSWVFTIAHRRMIDDRRRSARRPVVAHAEVTDDALVGDAEDDALAAIGDARLHELLEELSPDQRSVLLLRIVVDLPLEEVAVTLGKTVGAVKALQHRALATLRRHLESGEEAT